MRCLHGAALCRGAPEEGLHKSLNTMVGPGMDRRLVLCSVSGTPVNGAEKVDVSEGEASCTSIQASVSAGGPYALRPQRRCHIRSSVVTVWVMFASEANHKSLLILS
jgi:hypothetical protein